MWRGGVIKVSETLLFACRRVLLLVLVITVAAIALSVPDQTLDIYRRISERPDLQQLGSAALTMLLCVVCAFHATSCALYSSNEGTKGAPAYPVWLAGFPAVIGALVPAAVGYGILRASRAPSIPPFPSALVSYSSSFKQLEEVTVMLRAVSQRMLVFALVAWGVAIIVLVAPFIMHRVMRHRFSSQGGLLGLRHALFVAIAVFVTLSLIFAFLPSVSQFLGSITILNLFIAVTIIVVAYISCSTEGTFLLLLVFAAAGLFSWLNTNNNHVVTFHPLAEPRKVWDVGGPQPTFESWLKSRKDASHFLTKNKPYPVFIIAARGGGMYAAAQVGLFLTRMQDRCPTFSQHVFAISSVSGGSIGAAAFNALVQSHVENAHWEPCSFGPKDIGSLERAMREFVAQDYLSPVLAAALFPDLLQRMLFWRVSSFDRANVFERALESGWTYAASSLNNPLAGHFLDQWDATAAAPALVINTTEVETGKRNIIAPFAINASQELQYSWFYDPPGVPLFSRLQPLNQDDVLIHQDIKVSTAVVLSSRFPWLLPAGTLERGSENINLVDGGYFDNSGIETALDLLQRLRYMQSTYDSLPLEDDIRRHFSVYLISINGDFRSRSGEGLHQISAPIDALLSSREARGLLTQVRAQSISGMLVPARLDHKDYSLALGFQMSLAARRIIESQIGSAHECGRMNDARREMGIETNDDDYTQRPIDRLIGYNHTNSCQQCIISLMLTTGGEQVSGDHPCAILPDM
jgi:hypothetical protein